MGKNILKSVMMDTETTFYENGNMASNPNSWEQIKAPVTLSGQTEVMRGRLAVNPDGSTLFKAYRYGTGSKYHSLFTVLNGELKTTKRKKKVVVLSFRGGLSNKQVADGIRQQAAEIANFIEYRQR